jgi:hypothetical protein
VGHVFDSIAGYPHPRIYQDPFTREKKQVSLPAYVEYIRAVQEGMKITSHHASIEQTRQKSQQ